MPTLFIIKNLKTNFKMYHTGVMERTDLHVRSMT